MLILGLNTACPQTNNPRKMKELSALGVHISGRVPCVVQSANKFNVVSGQNTLPPATFWHPKLADVGRVKMLSTALYA